MSCFVVIESSNTLQPIIENPYLMSLSLQILLTRHISTQIKKKYLSPSPLPSKTGHSSHKYNLQIFYFDILRIFRLEIIEKSALLNPLCLQLLKNPVITGIKTFTVSIQAFLIVSLLRLSKNKSAFNCLFDFR